MNFKTQPIEREIKITGFNSIYYFEFDKDFTHPPEKHNFWELIYVDSGEVNAVTEGLGQTLVQGQILFNKPMELHAHISNKKVPNKMLVISFSTKSEAMEFFEKKVFTLTKTDKTPLTLLKLFMDEAKNALGELPSDYNNKNPLDFSRAPFGSTQLLECYLTEFLIALKRSSEDAISKVVRSEDSRELAQSSIAEMIAKYLEENVYSSLKLSDVSARFYLGKTQLCKIFHDHVGDSPIEYYSRLKMAEAKKLLRDGKLSVSRVSDMLGYSSIHNFSRAFKRFTGLAPTEYQKS